jgi:glycolate oxidase FAD binding subunit
MTLAPQSVDEAAALVREHAHDDAAFVFSGGGTDSGLGYEPERADATLDTRGLNRVVDYAPADMVIAVEAGMTLAALQAELAPHRQRLALDPAWPEQATIGGLLATNAFGPRRTRFGTLRDLIVGVTVVRADGTVAHGGGKVVKNVAGFDLPKLMVGSLGTLALIVQATFRLHPQPECERWYEVVGLSAETVGALCRGLLERRLEPSAVVARYEPGTRYTLHVLFEGFTASVDAQGAAWLELARNLGLAAHDPGVDGAPVRDETAHPRGALRVRISAPAAAFAEVDRDVLTPLREHVQGESVAYPLVGTFLLGGRSRDGADVAGALARARTACETLGGNLVVADMDADLRASIDPFGTLPASFPIMRRLKERFDPERRFNRGRFLGRL